LAKKYSRQLILLFVDGAGNHQSEELEVPPNIIMHLLPPYSPELNPQENLWDEIREKIFKNYALKSMDEVYANLGRSTGKFREAQPQKRESNQRRPPAKRL
jgi:transposase